MSMSSVVITRKIPQAGIERLQKELGVSRVWVPKEDSPMPRDVLLQRVRGAEAILCTITERINVEVMESAGPTLRIIANMAVGYDNIDVAAAASRTIIVTNTPGVLTDATADLTWALILGTARRVGEAERHLRGGQWEGWGPLQFLGMSVYGKTLGIFGMGRIGQAVARRAQGFQMTVLYHDKQPLNPIEERSLNASFVSKDYLLRHSDVLSLHCPLTEETRHAFTLVEFKLMKPTAILINTSRGPVIKEADLCLALKQGLLFAAGLDVYEREPEVYSDLLKEERVFLLPHIGSATVETRTTMAQMAAENIIAVLSGNAPLNPVLIK